MNAETLSQASVRVIDGWNAPDLHPDSEKSVMNSIIIDCDDCVMRATDACNDCLVTHMCDPDVANEGRSDAIVFDMAEHRAVRWFAEAGLVPTLRHRAASNS